jgi:RHS repeat-associated protein
MQLQTNEPLYQIMLARYYSSSISRFIAADPGNDTDRANPLSWNKYAYVRNNPLTSVDPTGKGTVGIPTSPAQIEQLRATAIVQQSQPGGQAADAIVQGRSVAAAAGMGAEITCETAGSTGTIAKGFSVALFALSAIPALTEATLPAAIATANVAATADGVALACDPSNPDRQAAVVGNAIGAGVAAKTASVLEGAAPAVGAAVKKAVAEVSGAAIGAAAEPPVKATITEIKK